MTPPIISFFSTKWRRFSTYLFAKARACAYKNCTWEPFLVPFWQTASALKFAYLFFPLFLIGRGIEQLRLIFKWRRVGCRTAIIQNFTPPPGNGRSLRVLNLKKTSFFRTRKRDRDRCILDFIEFGYIPVWENRVCAHWDTSDSVAHICGDD